MKVFVILISVLPWTIFGSSSPLNDTTTDVKLGKSSSRSFNNHHYHGTRTQTQDNPGQDNYFDPLKSSDWTVWDKPEDQVAIDQQSIISNNGVDTYHQDTSYNNRNKKNTSLKRRSKHLIKRPKPIMGQDEIDSKDDSSMTARQGCPGQYQMTFFPIVLILIAAIAGLVTILIGWIIARKWVGPEHLTTISSPSGGDHILHGTTTYPTTSSGYGRLLKNVDFDQLTNMALKAIEVYQNRT